MNAVIDFWNGLPTWGKVGVVVAGVGIVWFIARQKPSDSATPTQLILQPDKNAGIPYGSPLGGGSSGGNQGGTQQPGGNGGGSSGGNSGTTPTNPNNPGGGAVTPPSTQPPASSPGNTTLPPSYTVKPAQTIENVNQYVSQNRSTLNQQAIWDAHNAKVEAAKQINKSVDTWGQVYNNDGSYNSQLSAKYQSISDINGYVQQNKGKLSQSQISDLHSQKVALAQKQGLTVTADGHVFDKFGKAVGAKGMG